MIKIIFKNFVIWCILFSYSSWVFAQTSLIDGYSSDLVNKNLKVGNTSEKSILEPNNFNKTQTEIKGITDPAGLDTYKELQRASNINQKLFFDIHVVGDVVSPGTYRVLPSDRTSEIIKYAGGIRQSGSWLNIELRRGKERQKIDLSQFALTGDLSQNPYLVDGDVLFVPTKFGDYQIEGPVKRPGTYELSQKVSLKKAIDMAGGFSTGLSKSEPITVLRYVDGEKKYFTVFTDVAFLKEFKVWPGDIIVLPHVLLSAKSFDFGIKRIPGDNIFFPTINDNVYVVGSVTNPGAFKFQPSFKSHDYINLAGPQLIANLNRPILVSQGGKKQHINNLTEINAGDTIIVPEKAFTATKTLAWVTAIASVTLTAVYISSNLQSN